MKNPVVRAIVFCFAIIAFLHLPEAIPAQPAASPPARSDPRVVRVGAFNYYPGIFRDQDGVVKGFYVDALADIAQRENIRFEYVYGSWSEGLERIKANEVDVLTSVAYTPERALFMDYAKTPLLTVWGELYAPISSDIDDIRQVQGKKIAVMKNDFNARHFIELVKKFDITCEFIEMPGFDDVFNAIAEKKVDAGVANNTFGAAKQKEYGLRSTGVVFNPFDIFFTVARGKNQDLLSLLDRYLIDWRHKENSVYNSARQKWSHGTVGRMHVIPQWLITSAMVLGVLVLISLVFIVLLKQQVGRAVKKLSQNEEKYRRMTENIKDVIWQVTLDWKYAYISPAVEPLIGFTPAEMVGRNIFEFFTPSSREEVLKKVNERQQAAGQGLKLDNAFYEIEHVCKDGGTVWAEAVSTPLYDQNGTLTGFQGITRDITARKRAENESLRNRQFSESIMNSLPGIFYVFDSKGTFLRVNEKFLSVSAYSREEVMNMHPGDFFSSIDKKRIEDKTREVFEKGESSVEADFVSKDGKRTPYYFTGYRTMIDGAPLLVGVGIDITELKNAELALRETDRALAASEKKFKDLLESVQLIAVILDIEGNVTFCNGFLLDLTGWSRAEVLYKNWFDLFIPEQIRDAVKSVFRSAITQNTLPVRYENAILARDKTQKLIVWNNSILRNAEGGIIGVASIGTDVTEHRKIEEQFRQSQKMESIGTLAGGVAHDFNNILTAITGYGHLTMMKMSVDDPNRPNIQQILEASDRAAHLTKDLLMFSRKQPIDKKPIDLNEGIQKLSKFLVRVIGEDIAFKTTLSGGAIPVLADSYQIDQVLMNLATNARDAMPKGGAFTIITEKVLLDEKFATTHGFGTPGHYALISVSDTGQGMDEETSGKIFEPFFTTKEVGKGTGLGLSVVYGIVKQHDGVVTVYSEPGRGTTFRIYLPIHEVSASAKQAEIVEETPKGGTETILLAEDDKIVREMTTMMLEDFGYTVITAVDGMDAVQKFTENKDRIQLLLSDLIMPGMSGKDAYDEIAKLKPGIKVIFASGYDPDLVRQKALLEQQVPVVYKPVPLNALLKTIRSVLDEGN